MNKDIVHYKVKPFNFLACLKDLNENKYTTNKKEVTCPKCKSEIELNRPKKQKLKIED